MSYGFRARNINGHVTIDENLIGYAYLGKHVLPSQVGNTYVDFTCVGVPLVYFDVPYNRTQEEQGTATSLARFRSRTGVCMVKLQDLGSNNWRAHFMIANYNGPDLGLYIRVFGKIHLNFAASAGAHYGLRVRNSAGEVVFDYEAPMMALAGDTYGTEILLKPDVPMMDTDNADKYDTAVSVPFNMANKSICATTRGVIHYPYDVAGSYDVGSGQFIDTYEVMAYYSMYWANGSTLYARRVGGDSTQFQDVPGLIIDNSNCVPTYSRLAVIDNTRYP